MATDDCPDVSGELVNPFIDPPVVPPIEERGRLRDEDLSAIEEEICKNDPLWMISRHFVIHNKQGQLQLLNPLRPAQLRAYKILHWCHAHHMPARLCNGKSRKKGMSTFYAAYAFAQYILRDINVMIVAHEKELSETILSYIHRFYEYMDRPFDPTIPPIRKPSLFKGASSKDEIRFEGYQGKIWIGTAKNVYAGTGMTPQFLLASEVSKWDTGAATAISLLQSVAMKSGTTIVYECTFNGEDTLFFPEWKKCYENSKLSFDDKGDVVFEVTNPAKWNHYIPYFTGAGDDPDIWLEFFSEAERARFEKSLTDQERVWMDKYNMSLESINGMRAMFLSQCQGREEIRRQEFPMTPEEAVVASGDHRFNISKIHAMRDKYMEEGEAGELHTEDRWRKRVLWRREGGGSMIRYRQPVPGHRYIIGCDTAEGKYDEKYGTERDATVATCHDFDMGMEQVAIIYGNISSENIVAPLSLLAEYYNRAFVVIENNSSGTHTCIEMGKIYPRECLYHSGDVVSDSRRLSREIGFRTTVSTKGNMVGNLAAALEEDSIIIHCDKTFDELIHYIKKPGGGTEAAPGYHDDHTMATALAIVGAQSRPVLLDKRDIDPVERYYQLPRRQSPDETRNSVTGY